MFSPYHCEVSADATGKKFTAIETTTQVPGVKSKSNAKNQAFPMAVKLPPGTTCTGQGGACLIRCKNENSQREYPLPLGFYCDQAFATAFGGCFVVAQNPGAARRDSASRVIHAARYAVDSDLDSRGDEEEDADDVDTSEEVPFSSTG